MADKQLEGRLILTGEDRTSKMWASATRSLKGFSDRARALGGAFGLPRVARALGDVGRAAATTGRALSPLVAAVSTLTGIAAAGGLTAVAAGLKASADRIDEMSKKARQLGVSVQTLRQFAYVADLQGVSWDQASEALTKAAKGYAEVRLGVGRMSSQLEKISPKLADQIRKADSTAAAWNIMVGAIRNAKTEAEKIKLAELFFGTAEFTKIAELSQDQAKTLIDEFERLAGRITDKQAAGIEAWNDSLTRLTTAMRGISDETAVQAFVKLQPFVDSMTKLLSENRDKIATAIADALVKIANAVASVDWPAFGASLASLARNADGLATAFGGWSNVMIGVAAIPFLPLAASLSRLAFVLATTPAGITLAALVLLTYEAFKHWEDIDAWFARMAKANGFLEFFSELAKGVTKAVDSIGADLKRLEAMILPEWLSNLTPSAIGERISKGIWGENGGPAQWGVDWLQGRIDDASRQRPAPGKGDLPPGAITKRAAGGPVRSGGVSLVGERGPELVAWGADGTVIDAATTRALSSPATADRAGRAFAKHVVPPINRLNATMEELVRAIGDGWQPGAGGRGGGSSDGGGGVGGSGGGGRRRRRAGAPAGGPASVPNYQGIGAGLSAPPTWANIGAGLSAPPVWSKAGPVAIAQGGVAGSFSGGPNPRANSWMSFLMSDMGFSKAQAAGIVAGLMGESGKGLNPAAIGDGGTSIGTAQWHAGRATALKRFAAQRGTDWRDVRTQQEFLRHELQTSEAHTLKLLKQTETAGKALNTWVRVFERPANPSGEVARRSAYIPELMGSNFTPAVKTAAPGTGAPAPQAVNIGKGEIKVTIKTQGPGSVANVKSTSPENVTLLAGVDKTGERGWHPNRGQL